MKKLWLMAAVAAAGIGLPALAQAAPAFSTGNVNMRSGPSTRYPPVIVIPVGSQVDIRGCLSSANWCDVAYAGYRGWVSGTYLQARYSQRRVYVDPQYYRPLGIPTVTFSIGSYWDDHYRNRPFYRDRDRWRDNDGWRDRDRDRRSDARPGNDRPRDNDRPRVNEDRREPDSRRDANDSRDNLRGKNDQGKSDPRRAPPKERSERREREKSGDVLSPLQRELQQKVRGHCNPDQQRCPQKPPTGDDD